MAVLNVAGGGRGLSYYGNTGTETDTMAGTRTYWEWIPSDRHAMWPTAWIGQSGPDSPLSARAFRNISATPVGGVWYPVYYSEWIYYSWDLGWLTSQYGPPVSHTTTVSIPIIGVQSTGTRFGSGPWLSGSPAAHDLLACVPPAVQAPADLEWRNVSDVVLGPGSQGDTYIGTTITEWAQLNTSISGGTPRFPARPFPSTIGPGGWTQLGSYHYAGDIQNDLTFVPGTFVVPVDLTAHARDNHLVIVCAGLGQFTQDEALLTEVQSYDGNPPHGTTRYDTNEMWITNSRAQLLWNTVPPTPDDLGFEGRAHFFRGGPGEVPIGVQLDSGVTVAG